MSQTPHPLSTIYPLFVDLFGRSLRFNHQDFDKEAISDGCRSEIPGIVRGFSTLSDFRDLSFCGPCELCFRIYCKLFKAKIEEQNLKIHKKRQNNER